MEIIIVIEGIQYRAELPDSDAVRQLVTQFPLEETFRKSGEHEFFCRLGREINVRGIEGTSDIHRNGIYYFADWNALSFVYMDMSISPYEVVYLGEFLTDVCEDNLSAMRDYQPLSGEEQRAVQKVCEVFNQLNLIPCTSCRYCIEESECPKGILIPDMFSSLNAHEAFHNWNTGYYYANILTGNGHGKASECIKCGKCEKVCPQHLQIRELLRDVAAVFE